MQKIVIIVLLGLITPSIIAQNINFSFENPVVSTDGSTTFLDVDIMIESDVDFKLGAGQLYFNYNRLAFGDNVHANNRVVFNAPDDSYILGQTAPFPIYSSFITNDNTISRVSFSWQQALAAVCITTNVTSGPSKLCHLQLSFIDSGRNEPPNLCFESLAPFDNQTFTACGPYSGACTFSDCTNAAGNQLINDNFDCTLNIVLPVELISFQARAKNHAIDLTWTSEMEINFSHYELERSTDGKHFNFITKISGLGGEFQQDYHYKDKEVASGTIYYYRLKQVDMDFSYEYSSVQSAVFNHDEKSKIFPNPTRGVLFFEVEEMEFTTIIIHNMNNQIIKKIHSSEKQQTINVTDLPAGVYFLSILNGGILQENKRFVKV